MNILWKKIMNKNQRNVTKNAKWKWVTRDCPSKVLKRTSRREKRSPSDLVSSMLLKTIATSRMRTAKT